MNKINFTILLFSLIFVCRANYTAAQQPGGAITPEQRMRRDVTLLASDSLKGREAGTYSEKMASAYLSAQMGEIGLLPKGDHEGSYLSEFRMNFPVLYKKAKLKVNNIEFKHKEEFGATDLSSAADVSAPLVNVGKGQNGNNGKTDLNGKIVVIDIASGLGHESKEEVLASIISRVSSVVKQGAAGVILHNSSRKPVEDVLFGSPFTVSLDVPVVYVARLPYNKMRRLRTANCSLSVEIDRTVSKPANVIGWIDNKSALTVVIGAHYDHVGITKSRKGDDKTPQIHNGADDNASGTAALLELARWAVNNKVLKYNYIFIAFSAEEKGLFGSKAFCSLPWVNKDNIVYMLNMDMVGRLGCQGDTINILGMASSPYWDQVIAELAHPDFSIRKIKGAPAFSDHAPFLKKGIPVIYFTSGLDAEYHTPQDDTELINFKGMTEIVSYIRQFILSAETLPGVPFHKISPFQHIRAYFQTF